MCLVRFAVSICVPLVLIVIKLIFRKQLILPVMQYLFGIKLQAGLVTDLFAKRDFLSHNVNN